MKTNVFAYMRVYFQRTDYQSHSAHIRQESDEAEHREHELINQ